MEMWMRQKLEKVSPYRAPWGMQPESERRHAEVRLSRFRSH